MKSASVNERLTSHTGSPPARFTLTEEIVRKHKGDGLTILTILHKHVGRKSES